MLVIIPSLCFVSFFLIVYLTATRNNVSPCWRDCFLASSVICGVLLIAITELLNIFNLITLKWLMMFWGPICLISALICLGLIYKTKPAFRFNIAKIQPFEILLLCSVIFIVIIVGIIALTAPPNNWDSMTYHMSRVVHWIQNHNINHYPTNIDRQLTRSPWAEFTILHLQILSGGDRFANFVQWLSMIGSIIGVSLIAKQLGAKRREQIFAAVVVATIPMGILQASGTQNDYVVSFWLVCFVYYIMLMKYNQRIIYSLAAGASLGFAVLTKPSAYIYAFPFLGWYGISAFRNFRHKSWKPIFIIIFIAMLINIGCYVRNMDLYGAPLPKSGGEANKVFTISSLASNIIRHASLHAGVPSIKINNISENGIRFTHSFLGISADDPRTTFARKFNIGFSLHEDSAGNLAHLVLIIACALVFFMRRRQKNEQNLANYCFATIAAYLLFCFFLKWTPWQSRLHLPLFVLWSPFAAIVLSRNISYLPRHNRILPLLILIVFSCVIVSCLAYNYFGHNFIETTYKGEAPGFLNKIIEGQAEHSVGYYFEIVDNIFKNVLITSICFLVVLSSIYYFNVNLKNVIIVFLILTSLLWVFCNESKKIIGVENIFTVKRIDQYFANRPDLKNPYMKIADYIRIKRYSDVGISLEGDSWEYPFWVLLQNSDRPIRIEHINVKNKSVAKPYAYHFSDFTPDAIISISTRKDKVVVKEVISGQKWISE